MKSVKIGQQVSIPDRVIFPNRRDPYEWENGIITGFGKNKNDKPLIKVLVWNHFTKKTYEKWFLNEFVKKPSFHHYVGEKEDFEAWVENQSKLVGVSEK